MEPPIIDIRSHPDLHNGHSPESILDYLRQGKFPTILLYDEKGLQLFEKITHLEEYYLTEAELDVLKNHAAKIVKQVKDGSILVELGSGHYPNCVFAYPTESLSALPKYTHVTIGGLLGTYDDGLAYLRSVPSTTPKVILWLGSSIGNLNRDEAARFLAKFQQELNPGDQLLIGIDRRNPFDKVQTAYNDPQKITREFILNGLIHANRIFGKPIFNRDDWEYEGWYDEKRGVHQAWYVSKCKMNLVNGIYVNKGTKFLCEESWKWSEQETRDLWVKTKLHPLGSWPDSQEMYGIPEYPKTVFLIQDLHLAYVAPFQFDHPITKVPTIEEWDSLWKAWDLVTKGMIPNSLLYKKPISSRHDCHIPAFIDIHLSRALAESQTNTYFSEIFERGIDPDEEEGTCHPHSPVPKSWPHKHEILLYTNIIRDRLDKALRGCMTEVLKRTIWLGFEHTAMHLETLLYMLVQSSETLSPPGFPMPVLNPEKPEELKWRDFQAQLVRVGQDDESARYGWDNERPSRTYSVSSFRLSSQITNAQYSDYLDRHPHLPVPKSWTEDRRVKTFYGPVDLSVAGNWPVAASFTELDGFAKSIGGRLPTEGEMRLYWHSVRESDPDSTGMDYSLSSRCSSLPAFYYWIPKAGIWDWTSSCLEKYPGFQDDDVYPGYTSDFFDGKHNVVVGQSWATHPRLRRNGFGNWYRKDYSFVWAGGRVALDRK